MLTLIAMEAPATYSADAVRDEKVKVLRSIREIPSEAVVLGQYSAGTVDGLAVPAYRDVPGSTRIEYADIRRRSGLDRQLEVAGRALPSPHREGNATPHDGGGGAISASPVCLFHSVVDACIDTNDILRLALQPDEGFSLEVDVKEPGQSTLLRPVQLHFSYAEAFGRIPDAYETLLADVLEGDQTLFVRADETGGGVASLHALDRGRPCRSSVSGGDVGANGVDLAHPRGSLVERRLTGRTWPLPFDRHVGAHPS